MKNPLVIAVIVLLVLWYAFGVFMEMSFGVKWSVALSWPWRRIKAKFITPAKIIA